VEDASNLLADEQDGTGQAERVASGMDKRFPLKAIALTFSRFRHVLSLDADNFPAHNPERLLRSGGYVRTGALFWPDFWPLERANPIWDHISKKFEIGMQQESGQLLIDKQQHWKPLLLATHFNLQSEDYYQMLQGDKDTFQFAWRALNAPFTMIPIATGTGGYMAKDELGDMVFHGHTMVQFDVYQRPTFMHKNLRKWTTGLRPKHLNITYDERDWHYIKYCRPAKGYTRSPYACRALVDWIGGFITFKSYGEHASAVTISINDAIGYDLEAGLLAAFANLYKMPEYKSYVETNFGPAGDYLWSCRKCRMKADDMICECRGKFKEATETEGGQMGEWISSTLKYPHACVNAGFDITNELGYLKCSGDIRALQTGHQKVIPQAAASKKADASHMFEAHQKVFQEQNHEEVAESDEKIDRELPLLPPDHVINAHIDGKKSASLEPEMHAIMSAKA